MVKVQLLGRLDRIKLSKWDKTSEWRLSGERPSCVWGDLVVVKREYFVSRYNQGQLLSDLAGEWLFFGGWVGVLLQRLRLQGGLGAVAWVRVAKRLSIILLVPGRVLQELREFERFVPHQSASCAP
jgi:hypothetical protein